MYALEVLALQVPVQMLLLQAICNVMYACGALRHNPEKLREAVHADMLRRIDAYDARDWLRILWAHGTLAQDPGPLFNLLHQQVCTHSCLWLGLSVGAGVSGCAWACA